MVERLFLEEACARRIGEPWSAVPNHSKKVSRYRRARVWTGINVVPASIAFGSAAYFEFQEVFPGHCCPNVRIGVKSAVLSVGRSLPVCPQLRTFSAPVGMSQRCQNRNRPLRQALGAFSYRPGGYVVLRYQNFQNFAFWQGRTE